MTMRPVAQELPTVDGVECLTFCDNPSSPYPWRTERWMAARECWESEWHRVGKGGGQAKRWITHWLPLDELRPK